jgi:hypothetical protein
MYEILSPGIKTYDICKQQKIISSALQGQRELLQWVHDDWQQNGKHDGSFFDTQTTFKVYLNTHDIVIEHPCGVYATMLLNDIV